MTDFFPRPNFLTSPLLITATQVFEAQLAVCRIVQGEAFYEIIHKVRHNTTDYLSAVCKTFHDLKRRKLLASITKFSPFLSTYNLLCVGGHLRKAQFNYDFKQQIILPSRHRFTTLVVLH